MDITLRGKTYRAEYLTDTNFLVLGTLYTDENGRSLVPDKTDFDSLSDDMKKSLMMPVIKKLTDPLYKASLADSLSAIFPSLPKDLVSFELKSYKLNLEIKEILSIAISIGNELQARQENVDKIQVSAAEDIEAKQQRIRFINSQISALSLVDDFQGKAQRVAQLTAELELLTQNLNSYLAN